MELLQLFPQARSYLVLAEGWKDKSGVDNNNLSEVMDTLTIKWSTVASLPYPISSAVATICGDRLYLGCGLSADIINPTTTVVKCEARDLLQSRPQLATSHQTWSLRSPPVRAISLNSARGRSHTFTHRVRNGRGYDRAVFAIVCSKRDAFE